MTSKANLGGWGNAEFNELVVDAAKAEWVASTSGSGANLLQVSRWLGHSSVQITADVYGHLFPETNDQVIQHLDDALRASHAH